MSKNNNQISIEERRQIEELLRAGYSASEIGNQIGRSSKTIHREVKQNRTKYENDTHKFMFKEASPCDISERFPYVCFTCKKFKGGCLSKFKYVYNYREAQTISDKRRSISKTGIKITYEEKIRLQEIISKGVELGLSIEHIVRENDIKLSVRTIYRYIDSNVLEIPSYKMPLKGKRKPSKPRTKPSPTFDIALNGRTYVDYVTSIINQKIAHGTQMDCVLGTKSDKKAILTLINDRTGLFICKLLDRHTQFCVKKALDEIEGEIGFDNFRKLFPIILTDRGREFLNYHELEQSSIVNLPRTKIFYCDPYKPNQKGAIEQAHVRLRRFFPKGNSIQELKQRHLDLAMSAINSFTTNKAGGLSPFDLSVKVFGKEVIKKLGINYLPKDHLAMNNLLFTINKK